MSHANCPKGIQYPCILIVGSGAECATNMRVKETLHKSVCEVHVPIG